MQFRLPGRPWFKPRAYGFGAHPVTWEGWAFTASFVAGVISLAYAAFADPQESTTLSLILFVAGSAVLSFVYGVFAWLKTDGHWRWRWGARPDGQTSVRIVSARDEDTGRRR